jgi:hypothetical protein
MSLAHYYNEILNVLTAGVWDKVGIRRPCTADDAKLVARIIRNFLKVYNVMKDDPDVRQTCWFIRKYFGVTPSMGVMKDEPKDELPLTDDDPEYLLTIADFFEASGGLITTEEGDRRSGE